MIELKFTECENMQEPSAFKSGCTDYMLCLKCRRNGGWLYADLMPRGGVPLPPSAVAAGICAEETVRIVAADKRSAVFRLGDYLDRLDIQAKRMGLPEIDRELTEYGIAQLLSLSRPYISDGVTFLQITLMSAQEDAEVYPVREAVLTATLKKEQPQPMQAISVCTSSNCMLAHPHKFGAPFVCAVRDGIHEARERGYDNVLWLDATYMRYVDSLAGMDVFFHIGDKVVFAGDGFTADTARTLMEEWGIVVEKSRISTDQLIKDYENGALTEIFAVNTHDVVVPVTCLEINGTVLELARVKLAKKLYDTITSIHSGDIADTHGWVTRI